MIIREIKKDDNTKIKEIIQTSLKSHGLAMPGTAYHDPQLGNLYQYYKNLTNAKYWVLDVEGEVVGGVGIAPFNDNDSVCELQKLYVSENVQGLGYGQQLMEIALSFASKYYSRCYLETMHKLEVACVLYEKFEFQSLNEPLPGSEHSVMDAWYIKELQLMNRKKEMKEMYKHMKPNMGLFVIKCNVDNKCYIEGSQDLKSNINSAKFKLEAGLHPNRELQRYWKEYGESSFTIEILEQLKYDEEEAKDDYTEELLILKLIWEDKLTNKGSELFKK